MILLPKDTEHEEQHETSRGKGATNLPPPDT